MFLGFFFYTAYAQGFVHSCGIKLKRKESSDEKIIQ